MDFAKFVSLLENQTLHFSRCDSLGDPFEGTITATMLEALEAQSMEVAKGKNPNTPPAPSLVNQIRQMFKETRQNTFVNCWHCNDHESAAMWRLYSLYDQGISIVSNYDKLREALPSFSYIGRVNYIDFNKDFFHPGNLFNPIMHKRISFAHENEVRAVITTRFAKPPENISVVGSGIQVPIEINKMIDTIYVHPESPNWYLELVSSLVKRYAVEVEVLRSNLGAAPID